MQYEMGFAIRKNHFANNLRAKTCAALRTGVFKSHYLGEKFITSAYCQKAKEIVGENPDALVVYSLISTASLALTEKPAIIMTHNDEIAWFQNQFLFSNNLLYKLTARISENWTREFLTNHARDFVFVHITQNDYEGYKRWMPEHKAFVVPVGVDMQKISDNYHADGMIRLLFVGSLNVKMNYDALVFFRQRFWPVLKEGLSGKIEVVVLGSQPTNQVRQLCRREGWQLFPDASDEELHSQYNQASFAILPYFYTNGAKLKLLNSLAAGLPVLATTNMNILPYQRFSPNLYSDDPQVWCNHVREFISTGVSLEQRLSCQEFASQYTWEKIATEMDKKLRQLEI
jgi:glycosyltransferase involved in cell wall biosynthesis